MGNIIRNSLSQQEDNKKRYMKKIGNIYSYGKNPVWNCNSQTGTILLNTFMLSNINYVMTKVFWIPSMVKKLIEG
jgi:hypothetical protein